VAKEDAKFNKKKKKKKKKKNKLRKKKKKKIKTKQTRELVKTNQVKFDKKKKYLILNLANFFNLYIS